MLTLRAVASFNSPVEPRTLVAPLCATYSGVMIKADYFLSGAGSDCLQLTPLIFRGLTVRRNPEIDANPFHRVLRR